MACDYRADYTAREGRWETTNQHFYVDLPADKRLTQPGTYDAPLDKSNFIRAGLTKECFDGSLADETPGGRAGARGKLSCQHSRSKLSASQSAAFASMFCRTRCECKLRIYAAYKESGDGEDEV